jgi:anti-anti-sigma regulatory factor
LPKLTFRWRNTYFLCVTRCGSVGGSGEKREENRGCKKRSVYTRPALGKTNYLFIVGENEILEPLGQLKGREAADLVEKTRASTRQKVIVDLHNVGCLDSCGIGSPIYSQKPLSLVNRKLVLAAPSKTARELIYGYGIDQFIPLIEDCDVPRQYAPDYKIANC